MRKFIEHVLNYWNPPPAPQAADRVQAYRKLRESFGADPFDLFYDRYYANGQWFIPTGGSVPGIGGTSNRVQGKNAYVFRTEQELRIQRDRARSLYENEPIAQAIMGHLRAFTVGNGFTYTIKPKKRFADTMDAEVIELIQETLDEWLDKEAWCEREAELFNCQKIDGEWFLRIIEERSGITVRRLEPEHITDPPGGNVTNGWYLGVQCDVSDVETVLGYYYHAYPHNSGELIDTEEIIHFKEGVPRNVTRGVSAFFCLSDDLDGTGKLIDNNRDGAAARARIAYIRSHKNVLPDAVSDFAAAVADSTSTKPNGATGYHKSSRGSVEVDAGENMEIKTMPSGDVEGNIAAVAMMYRVLGNRFNGMPEFMVSGDASNNNYASILVSGGPFVRQIELDQNRLKYRYKKLMERVLKYAAKRAKFAIELLDMVEVDVQAPSPVIEDKLQQAQTFDIEARNGVISPPEWCGKLGRDYEKIQAENDEYKDHNLEAMVAQNDALGGGEPSGNTDIFGMNESIDAKKHHHKDKGPGGGQFTSNSGGGATTSKQSSVRKNIVSKKDSADNNLSEKAQKAKDSAVRVDKTIQRYAEEHNEPKFAKAVGGLSFPNSEPVDVVVGDENGVIKHGIELKTMVVNSNNKITMKRSAMDRKAEWEKKNKASYHTVVFDDSAVFNAKGDGKHDETKRVIYYRRGFGSFRVGGMHQVKSIQELKTLMEMKNDQLPKAAQRTDK